MSDVKMQKLYTFLLCVWYTMRSQPRNEWPEKKDEFPTRVFTKAHIGELQLYREDRWLVTKYDIIRVLLIEQIYDTYAPIKRAFHSLLTFDSSFILSHYSSDDCFYLKQKQNLYQQSSGNLWWNYIRYCVCLYLLRGCEENYVCSIEISSYFLHTIKRK